MPGKSRRGRRGKYAFQSKKQGGSGRPNPVVQPSAGAEVPQSPSVLNAPAPPRIAPAHHLRRVAEMVKPSAVRYAMVPTEIKTIAILAGLILIGLVVLARVLA